MIVIAEFPDPFSSPRVADHNITRPDSNDLKAFGAKKLEIGRYLKDIGENMVSFKEFEALELAPKSVALMWYNKYSGTAIKTPSTIIHIDPVDISPKAIKKADAVIVSHEHWDHFDRKTLEEIHRNTGARIIGNSDVVSELGASIPRKKIQALRPGKEIIVGEIRIRGEQSKHPRREPLTLVIITEDEIIVYHATDSEPFEGMRKIGKRYRPDVAIVPIGIAPGASPKAGAEIVELVRPEVVIPHTEQGFEEFEKLVKKSTLGVEVVVLELGETYEYSKWQHWRCDPW